MGARTRLEQDSRPTEAGRRVAHSAQLGLRAGARPPRRLPQSGPRGLSRSYVRPAAGHPASGPAARVHVAASM